VLGPIQIGVVIPPKNTTPFPQFLFAKTVPVSPVNKTPKPVPIIDAWLKELPV